MINKTSTSMNVFPASGDTINTLSANTAIAVTSTTPVIIFYCGTAGSWWTK